MNFIYKYKRHHSKEKACLNEDPSVQKNNNLAKFYKTFSPKTNDKIQKSHGSKRIELIVETSHKAHYNNGQIVQSMSRKKKAQSTKKVRISDPPIFDLRKINIKNQDNTHYLQAYGFIPSSNPPTNFYFTKKYGESKLRTDIKSIASSIQTPRANFHESINNTINHKKFMVYKSQAQPQVLHKVSSQKQIKYKPYKFGKKTKLGSIRPKAQIFSEKNSLVIKKVDLPSFYSKIISDEFSIKNTFSNREIGTLDHRAARSGIRSDNNSQLKIESINFFKKHETIIPVNPIKSKIRLQNQNPQNDKTKLENLINKLNQCNVLKNPKLAILSSKNLKELENKNSLNKNSNLDSKITNKIENSKKYIINYVKSFIKENNKLPPTTLDFYLIGKVLGRGAFGKVNLCINKLTGKLVAIKSVKKINLQNEESKKKYENELSILKGLRHPNIIMLFETFENEKKIFLVMELCVGGDLLSYLKKRRKIKESVAKIASKNILYGLHYLHSKGIAHRDIKLDNILLNNNGHIKICDFGVSKLINESEKMYEKCGTPAYIAPEVIRRDGYDGRLADIWSSGIVLFLLLYGTVPFKSTESDELQEMILNQEIIYEEGISNEGKEILNHMLEKDTDKRWTAKQLLESNWIKTSDDSISLLSKEEKESINNEFQIREYESSKKLDNQKSTIFTEYSIDTNENQEKLDASKSSILAPFNSANSIPEEFENSIKNLIANRNLIKLDPKLREIDRNYERNNNKEIDNGVYIDCEYSNYSLNLPEYREEDEHIHKNKIQMIDEPSKKITLKDINFEIVNQIESYGIPRKMIVDSLLSNAQNCCTTAYYLILN